MKGFKNFLMRGDVIVVAVGLVVALAFNAVLREEMRQVTGDCRIRLEGQPQLGQRRLDRSRG